MMPTIRGRAAYIFGEANFDVDRILGFDAMRSHDHERMKAGAMRAFDTEFAKEVRTGDILIGGSNFGYGHPHGPPMAIMRSFGVKAVIAESFSPLYLMGELAAGFVQITCGGISETTQRWDELEVDWRAGRIMNHTSGTGLDFEAPTRNERLLLKRGGLFALLRSIDLS